MLNSLQNGVFSESGNRAVTDPGNLSLRDSGAEDGRWRAQSWCLGVRRGARSAAGFAAEVTLMSCLPYAPRETRRSRCLGLSAQPT
jgi:hypothetical protein